MIILKKDLISVIIPIYNVEKYLHECVDSVLKQTYKNIEIILVDDGSTDSCPEICDEYSVLDSRVKVIHKVNGGLSDARNAGKKIALGKYISFIDSDDSIEFNYIEYLYDILIINNADMSCCQKKEIDDGSKLIRYLNYCKVSKVNGNYECMKAFFSNIGLDTFAWGKLYKSKMIENIDYPYGKVYEDVFTTHKIIAECSSIAIGDKCLYNYRIRANSITTSKFSMKQYDRIEAHKIRTQFIRKKYPDLESLASQGIVYATNQCLLKMACDRTNKLSSNETCKLLESFQFDYRIYTKDFLKSKCSFFSKMFSILASYNIKLVYKIIRTLSLLKLL